MSRKRQCSSGSEIIVLYASRYCFFATNAKTDSHFDPTASDLAEYSGKDRPHGAELPCESMRPRDQGVSLRSSP